MTVIRLILLVAVLGGLTLLLAQNWSPAIPLVFLGWQTKPLSLAIWMLFGTAAGAFTSLLISSLLRLLPNRYVTQPRQTRSYAPSDSPRVDPPRPNETYRTTPRVSTPGPPNEFENTADDDWDLDKNVNDDWDFEERFEPRSQVSDSRSSYTKIQDDRDYEDFQEPSYSPQKRDFKNPNVAESVYDADYRVITPPPNQSATSNDDADNDDDNDDWGLFDEDLDDDDKRSPRQ